ncbi:hypothetical protein EHS25_002630 [Saitozyma podzolica]|uniref:Uncharacterized protein n=1 Tax=Saitozyma podzolica TaxID=1890683 RepID=A0A427YD01_9TREE|nr:hypothetical protein EHS25_002630 [Saitozyma podzolica]
MIAPIGSQYRETIENPSQAIKAARAAASSPHALVNLIRLVGSLDAKSQDNDEAAEAAQPGYADPDVKRDWESVLYARALLEALEGENEQSSTTSSTLSTLKHTLATVEGRYAEILQRAQPVSSSTAVRPTVGPVTYAASASAPGIPSSSQPSNVPIVSAPPDPPAPVRQRRRKAPTAEEYLATRQRQDALGSDTGLLPLKTPATAGTGDNGPGARDRLLGDVGSRGAVGSSQLHEELGGQLADMSHRLKLNAIHFASSLEGEKALLESSQDALEKNLDSTRSSKKHLGTVSSKSRGTTCMTLGIVVLVMVLFVWTYMLIRFT